MITSCVRCKRKIKQAPTGRPRLYCSAACKQHAYEERRLEAAREDGRQQAVEELQGRTFLA